MKIPAYLLEVLKALKDCHDETFWVDVEHVRASFYRVEAPDGRTIIVDTKRRMVDDSIEPMLWPVTFPGRIEPEHIFRVEWIEDGKEICCEIEASSGGIARMHMRAPPHAVVQEVWL